MNTKLLFVGAALTALLTGCAAAPGTNADATTDTPPLSTTKATTEVVAQSPKVGEESPDFELSSIGDEKIKLSEMVKSGAVVLVMLRGYPGYQCPICTKQVAQLMDKSKQFADAKANVLLVYPGPAEGLKAHADEFVRGKDMPENFHLLLDPDYNFTNLYGLRWDAKGETSYPSTFVLNGERKVLFAKISHEHGDRAKVEDILAALPK